MQVDKKIIRNWKILREHGDVRAIAEESGYSHVTISEALNDLKGKMSREVFDAINKFYRRRERENEQLVNSKE
jgi:hypothetical protein